MPVVASQVRRSTRMSWARAARSSGWDRLSPGTEANAPPVRHVTPAMIRPARRPRARAASAIAPAHDEIDQLVRDEDHLSDLGAVHVALDPFVGERGLLR